MTWPIGRFINGISTLKALRRSAANPALQEIALGSLGFETGVGVSLGAEIHNFFSERCSLSFQQCLFLWVEFS